MSKERSEPKAITRLPNARNDVNIGETSSYSSNHLRAQANARLGEAVSPSVSPFGSFQSQRESDLFDKGVYEGRLEVNSSRSSMVQAVKKHLVQRDDITSPKSPNLEAEPFLNTEAVESEGELSNQDYSVSHTLLGGDVTRNIYKWHEDEERNQQQRRRSKSLTSLQEQASLQDSQAPRLADILLPGGFRRHHVLLQAEREGRTRNIITSNFLDFLALYGHFAGDVYPEDGEEEEDTEQGMPNERSPLIGGPSFRASHASAPNASVGKAVFLLIKSFVGTGILFLPRSFYDGGMAFSLLILLFISFFCLHCMLLLVDTQAKVGGSFGDLGMALYGNWARHLVLVSIVLSQFGFCCAYMIFIAKNLQDVFYGVTECRYLVSESWFFIVQLLVYIPVALLRKIKSLSAIAIVADGFIILGLVYLVGYNLVHISNYGPGVVQNFNREGFTLFIGTAIFTFEGIGLIIPIVESMKEPEKFPAILAWTMVGFTALYLFVGSLSYATFGGEVRTVVLSNLPQGTVASACIQTMYALAIVLSVPLQFFPIIGILEAGLFTRSGRGSLLVKWQKNIFRLMIVLSTAAVAWLGASSLDHIVSIVGSLCCIPLSFIYPAIFHLKAFPNVSYAQKIKDISIVVAGFLLMIYVSLQTLANWNTSGEGAISPCTPPSH